MFFLLFLLDDGRIRIREAQKHMDTTDPDPEHWLSGIWLLRIPEKICPVGGPLAVRQGEVELLRLTCLPFLPPRVEPAHSNGLQPVLWIRMCFNANSHPTIYLNADPDPGSQTNEDPWGSGTRSWVDFEVTKVEFCMKNIPYLPT